MNTAKILFEQYKILPKKVKTELKTLINSENKETVDIAIEPLKEGLKELKSVLSGKSNARPISELLKELENES